jgi:hypothetical protein
MSATLTPMTGKGTEAVSAAEDSCVGAEASEAEKAKASSAVSSALERAAAKTAFPDS